MNEETKRELLKAYFNGFSLEEIAKIMRFSEEEIKQVIDENSEILKELEARNYETA